MTISYAVVCGAITPTEALRALIVEAYRKGRDTDALMRTLQAHIADPDFDMGHTFIHNRNEPAYWIKFNK